MPEERDIEKSLRAWAKRRREDAGAPLDLHPATRKLLQDEIARLKSAPHRAPGPLARWLWGSPLRLALNISALAVLIFAAAVFLPQPKPASSSLSGSPAMLAENKRMPDQNAAPAAVASDNLSRSGTTPPVESSPTVAAAPAVAAQQPVPAIATRKAKPAANSIALADDKSFYQTPAESAAPGVAPPVPIAAPVSVDEEKLANRPSGAASLAIASANRPAAGSPEQKLSWLNSPSVMDRRDGAVAKLGAAAILTSFRTEQSGNQLRVIDSDGSVYAGSLTAPTEILDSNGAFRTAQTRAFRVTGTNLTLRQPVIFTGNLVFADQSSTHGQKDFSGASVVNGGFVSGGGGGGGFGGAGTNRVVTQSGSTPIPGAASQTAIVGGALPAQPQFRVEGRAVIGTNEIQINAVPVAR